MTNVYPIIPKLSVHRQFINELMAEDSPCFGFGMIEEYKQKMGLIAFRPAYCVLPETQEINIEVKHNIRGESPHQVIFLQFEFCGFDIYPILINLNNPIVQAVLDNMIAKGEYYILIIASSQKVTAFRVRVEENELDDLIYIASLSKNSAQSENQYLTALNQFQKNPCLMGRLFNWVCKSNPGYLDISADRLEMNPYTHHNGNNEERNEAFRVTQRLSIAKYLDDKVNQLVHRSDDGGGLTLLYEMAEDMQLFKRLIELSNADILNVLCATNPGLNYLISLLKFKLIQDTKQPEKIDHLH